MDDGKSNLEGRSNIAEDSSNKLAANSSSRQANPHNGVELPPPYSQYSQVPSTAQNLNQPGMHYPVQHQGYPLGGYQQSQFQLGRFPPKGGVLYQADKLHVGQEHAMRQGIATSLLTGESGTYRLARLGIGIMLLGITLLIVFGVLMVRPALNDLTLQSVQCKVLSSEYTDEDMSCKCGRYCTSSYPCLQIHVSYSAEGKRQTAYLYQDVYVDNNKCSIQSCDSVASSNYNDVKEFKEEYGNIGQLFTCYYNPKTPAEVFKNRGSVSSDKMTIMHCILWPLVFVLLSASMLGILFCRAKGHCCFKKDMPSVSYQELHAGSATA